MEQENINQFTEQNINETSVSNTTPMTESNTNEEEPIEFLDLYPARTSKRFVNYIIDYVCYFIFTLIVALIFGIIFILITGNIDSQLFESKIFNYSLVFICMLFYYTVFEALTGRTIGKYITKTVVIDEYGNRPTLKALAIRSLCRLIPFEPLSLLASDNEGWHDTLSKTRVVDVKDLKEALSGKEQ